MIDPVQLGCELPTHYLHDLRDLIGKIERRFKTSYIRRAREYCRLVMIALANSEEWEFPVLRAWLRDTGSIYTRDQQAERLYDDALAQLHEADSRQPLGFAAEDENL